jgi:hypothetical protein
MGDIVQLGLGGVCAIDAQDVLQRGMHLSWFSMDGLGVKSLMMKTYPSRLEITLTWQAGGESMVEIEDGQPVSLANQLH